MIEPLDFNLPLQKAESALDTANHDLEGGFLLAVANWAYYTIFYCMNAFLYSENVYAKTHKGVHVKFVELFIKTGKIEKKYSDFAQESFNYRQDADYDMEANFSKEQVEKLLAQAHDFLNVTKLFLQLQWFWVQKHNTL